MQPHAPAALLAVVVIADWDGILTLEGVSWWMAPGVPHLAVALGAVAMAGMSAIPTVQTNWGG